MINAFVLGAVTVQFDAPPLRAGGDSPELFQVEGRDSLGTRYVYDKGAIVRTSRRLSLKITTATLNALLGFAADASRGGRKPFTWYDHEGTAHTVRLVGSISHQQIGPDRHRAEIALEEDAVWPDPGPGYGKDSITGAAPVWILKLTVGGVSHYLSDMTISIASWEGGITTKPWVAAWGSVQEGISNSLSEIRVSDFSLTCLIDPDAAPNMETLATGYVMEANPAELYLWFRGQDPVASPPVMKFRGYVKDVDIPDNTTATLVIEDETVRLGKYLGTKVDRTAYPAADPDDIGKVIPIPFGSVQKLPALAVKAGIQTSLPNGISSTATSFLLSDAQGLAVGASVQIDDEEIYISAISGDSITNCVRGYNGTLAAAHQKGAVAWETLPTFDYVVSYEPVDLIEKVFARMNGSDLDITAISARYTGQPGSEHPNYPGRAVVSLAGYVTITQAVELLVQDGISIDDAIQIVDGIGIIDGITVTDEILIDDGLTVTDGISISDGIMISDLIGVSDGIVVSDGISVSTGSHNHGTNDTISQATTTAWPGGSLIAIPGNGSWYADFTDPGGTRLEVTYEINLTVQNVSSVTITAGGVTLWSGAPPSSSLVITKNYSSGGALTANRVNVSWSSSLSGYGGTIYNSAKRTLRMAAAVSSSAATGVAKSGTVSKTGSVSKSGTVSRTGAVSKSGTVSRTGAISKSGTVSKTGNVTRNGAVTRSGSVSKNGTITLSGNSVANTLVGDIILCDVVRNVTTPGDVVSNILSTYCGVTSFQQVGAFPASYAINGAITEYRTALDWLNEIAFQCRAWFRMELGTAKLIVRPDALAPIKTIPACRATNDGRRIHRRRKAPFDDIINKINLLFDRDWSKSKGDDAYRGMSKATDATSIANYGERERPELFLCDFITTQAMADDVRAFYLLRYAGRQWLHEFETYLDHSELKFSNAITLGFSGNTAGEIIEAGCSPGSSTQIDTVKFTVLA